MGLRERILKSKLNAQRIMINIVHNGILNSSFLKFDIYGIFIDTGRY